MAHAMYAGERRECRILDTSSKICACGARFSLQVELAVHCRATGHTPLSAKRRLPPASVNLAPERQNRRRWKRTLLACAALLCLTGLTCGANAAVRSYTTWQGTANVLQLP